MAPFIWLKETALSYFILFKLAVWHTDDTEPVMRHDARRDECAIVRVCLDSHILIIYMYSDEGQEVGGVQKPYIESKKSVVWELIHNLAEKKGFTVEYIHI